MKQKFTKPKSKAGQLADSLPQSKSREPTIEVLEVANSPVRKSVLSVLSPKSMVDDNDTLLQDLASEESHNSDQESPRNAVTPKQH